jgi:DNA-binding NarL/FixJ family response regulator
MNPIRLAIIEDDPEVQQLLRQYLGRQDEFECVIVVDSAEAFLRELAVALPPQAILLDLGLPGMSGLELLPLLRTRLPDAEIVIQTAFEDPDRIYQALCGGASGYVLKNTQLPQIKAALLEVMQGGAFFSRSVARRVLQHFKPNPTAQPTLLSEREHTVLQGIVDGLADKQIAARLELAVPTVRTHVRNIYRKLQVNSRGELLSRAAKGAL